MIGILVASHGEFSRELVKSAEMIVGKIENCDSQILLEGGSIEEYDNALRGKIQALDGGDGILVLVDLFCGTPFNRINMMVASENINARIITGMNLPMLLNASSERCGVSNIQELIDIVLEQDNLGIQAVQEVKERETTVFDDGCEED